VGYGREGDRVCGEWGVSGKRAAFLMERNVEQDETICYRLQRSTMALITCYECGDKVSTTAAACPHCGAPVKKDAVRKDSEVKAENEHTFRAINQIGEVVEQRVNPPELKQNSKLRAGVILAAA